VSVWLILSPAIVWLLLATWGRHLLRADAVQLWKGMQPFRMEPKPYVGDASQRMVIAMFRMQGWLLLGVALFITLMATLVAVGVVPPAKN
jgi:hypothetical protein